MSANEQLAAARGIFESGLEKLEADRITRLRQVETGYRNYLQTLVKNLQSKGDLEGVIAARKEADRFAEEGNVPQEPADDTAPDHCARTGELS